MQTTILLISLSVMLAALVLILRPILATDGPGPSEKANSTRSQLLWAMTIFGIVLAIASLREWPHVSANGEVQVVNITSGQWWWDTDTTEIALGQQVEFRVTTEDVNHGLGIYDPDMQLVAQVQAMPGYTNKLVHTFDKPGTYQILCMEFCGLAHHDMTYEFDVLEASS